MIEEEEEEAFTIEWMHQYGDLTTTLKRPKKH